MNFFGQSFGEKIVMKCKVEKNLEPTYVPEIVTSRRINFFTSMTYRYRGPGSPGSHKCM